MLQPVYKKRMLLCLQLSVINVYITARATNLCCCVGFQHGRENSTTVPYTAAWAKPCKYTLHIPGAPLSSEIPNLLFTRVMVIVYDNIKYRNRYEQIQINTYLYMLYMYEYLHTYTNMWRTPYFSSKFLQVAVEDNTLFSRYDDTAENVLLMPTFVLLMPTLSRIGPSRKSGGVYHVSPL